MPQRASIAFQISNPLGAADVLLHGDGHLHGWGQQFVPNNQLLYVRGFDQTTQRYKYEVNQRFGATNPRFVTLRSPVRKTPYGRFSRGKSEALITSPTAADLPSVLRRSTSQS